MKELCQIIIDLSITDKISLFALVVSVLSILFSIYSLRLQKRLNAQNLQAIYFEKIFLSYLLNKIPEVARKLDFDSNGKLKSNYRDINDIMMSMVKEAAYFSYSNQEFYCELMEKTKELEDNLLELSNMQIRDREIQKEKLIQIHKIVSDIVIFINNNYCK